ncbi:MAG: hypothetical protein ABIG68_06210 [Acidobacteriota bacterium]
MERGPHLNEDQCINLLYELSPPGERERLLAHLESCTACERLFMSRVQERENLRASKALRRRPDGRFTVEDMELEDPGGGAGVKPIGMRVRLSQWFSQRLSQWWMDILSDLRQHRVRWTMGFMITAAALLLLVLSQAGPPDVRVYRLQPVPDEIQTHLGPGSSAPGGGLMLGFQAYAEGDFDAAMDRLRTAEAPEDLEAFRAAFLGSALALRGEFNEAMAVLRSADLNALPLPWRCEAEWTLYVALMRKGREAEADALLRAIAREPGAVGERARDQQRRTAAE